jgi:hypothetical protein
MKHLNIMIEQRHITDAALHQIKCDVLVTASDRDFIRKEHTRNI